MMACLEMTMKMQPNQSLRLAPGPAGVAAVVEPLPASAATKHRC